MTHYGDNTWKGFLLGSLGGVAGVLAMRSYWKAVSAIAGGDPRAKSKQSAPGPLDFISVLGTHHEPGESSTAAMGRYIYRSFTGTDPQSQETRTVLSYAVHWLYSMLMAGVYGGLRGRAGLLDMRGGAALGVGVWLFGDELATPVMGFASGPTAYPVELHAYGLGAHLAYGLGTSVMTQMLLRITT